MRTTFLRIVLQRVTRACVRVNHEVVGEIGHGLLALVGVERGDREDEVSYCANKLAGLRIFADDRGRMNLDVRDVGGALLAVSQFTLAAEVSKGRRPSFGRAAEPEEARRLYEVFLGEVRKLGIPLETGEFGAAMEVELVNDGPVTFVLERRPESR